MYSEQSMLAKAPTVSSTERLFFI